MLQVIRLGLERLEDERAEIPDPTSPIIPIVARMESRSGSRCG